MDIMRLDFKVEDVVIVYRKKLSPLIFNKEVIRNHGDGARFVMKGMAVTSKDCGTVLDHEGSNYQGRTLQPLQFTGDIDE